MCSLYPFLFLTTWTNFRGLHSSARCAPAGSPNLPPLRSQILRSRCYDHPVHGSHPFSRTAMTPVGIKHSAFKSPSAFLRASEKGGLLKLKDARLDAQVAAVFLAQADVVAHQLHRSIGDDERMSVKRGRLRKPRTRKRPSVYHNG